MRLVMAQDLGPAGSFVLTPRSRRGSHHPVGRIPGHPPVPRAGGRREQRGSYLGI